MARTGPFLWAKAVNHHLESDRRTAPGCARCIEGLLMTSIEDAVPIDAALQCILAHTGPFLRAKAVNHHLESDRRTAPGWCHDPQTVQSPARDASREIGRASCRERVSSFV